MSHHLQTEAQMPSKSQDLVGVLPRIPLEITKALDLDLIVMNEDVRSAGVCSPKRRHLGSVWEEQDLKMTPSSFCPLVCRPMVRSALHFVLKSHRSGFFRHSSLMQNKVY